MYLKSIEVQGFKSFAHKMKFEFHNGITGIVGPNGSGKSNVADAVRWVLGEQRVKQLRGGSMQDVIFAGTENRKPLSYASVAITLDNSDHQLAIDYEEVTVARRLYRSGESEYLLNGSQCRLKDINELFYDTGIGKEGYSIIGQGQIDKILSGKPEDRRELFDEAAGIVKFKRRKNMSVKKLEEERQNLLRVTDILAELEKQKDPLERQAEKAKIYLKKKDELKTYDINMFLLETERLNEKGKDLEEKLEIARNDLQNARKEYEAMKQEYDTIEEEVEIIDNDIETAKNQLNNTNILKQQLENKIAILKEQIRSAHMNDEHYGQRVSAINAEIETREAQLKDLYESEAKGQEELSSLNQESENARKELIEIQMLITELSASVEQKQNDIMELLNRRVSTKADVQRFETMLEQIQLRKKQLDIRTKDIQADMDREKEEYIKYESDLKEISGKIIKLSDESKDYEAKIKNLQDELTDMVEDFNRGQSQYHREKSKLESLKNLTERYDGYGNSIKKVMDCRNTERGLLGVVADIIKVDKKYETAIETALGGNIQNIVTSDENTAKRMIQFLKKNKFGRATFLPLTTIKGNGGISRPEALREAGVIGPADQLVTVDGKYEKLAGHLLGRTLVVDNIDTGIRIAAKYNQSLRIVTLEGELMNPGGSMTGGAFKNTSALLSRRREIEELEKTVAAIKERMSDFEGKISALRKKRTELYANVDALKEDLQKAYVVQNTAKMNVNQSSAKMKSLQNSLDDISAENATLEKQIGDILDNQESISVELETSEKLEKNLSSDIESDQKELEAKRILESEKQSDTEKLSLSLAAAQQKSDFNKENISRIEEEIDKYNIELKDLSEGKDGASLEIQQKEKEIEELTQTIEDSKELFDEIGQEIDRLKKDRDNLNKMHKDFLQKREDLSTHMNEIDKEVFRLESNLESNEEALDKQINYMWEEYELTFNHAMELRNPNLTDLSKMKKRIAEIKSEIKGLGSVNVNAIEDFKSLSERYEFLKTQHDDLVVAENTLVQIIEELDEAMRRQFREQFDRISKEFDKVFKELFGGGKGTLELMEDEDVLDAGIKIIAQPPGKKLQNMMQLSGGEKALTAIALLFAIQNLKPSPFCLLDEIEAALDDNNVGRFAQYLHKLTKSTQFIVITHRRGTMTAADRLYGITMQEKGVSALVSVSLLENELDQ